MILEEEPLASPCYASPNSVTCSWKATCTRGPCHVRVPFGSYRLCAIMSPLIAHRLHEEGWSKAEVKAYLYERARVPLERVQRYKQRRYGRPQEAGVMVPVVRSPEHLMVLVAGDPAWSRSAYCPARPYN
jgi:hypothetical protein